MLAFACLDNINLPTTGLKSTEPSSNPKKDEFRRITKVKSNTSAVRSAILADLVPHYIGFVLKSPRIHHIQTFPE